MLLKGGKENTRQHGRYVYGVLLLIFTYCLGFFMDQNSAPTAITHLLAQIDDATNSLLVDNSLQSPLNTNPSSSSSSTLAVVDNNKITNVLNINPSLTCDACTGTFQYDAPNHSPNATEILFEENRTYSAHPKYNAFLPIFTTPEQCIEQWVKNSKLGYARQGMSAHAEDLVIFNAFFKDDPKLWNKNSFYLEIGGHNGVLESSTRFFDVCLGWDGLLVEPIPQSYHRMVKLRPNAHHLLMAPSCEEPSIAKFHNIPFTNGIANAEGATLEIHCGPLSHPFHQMGIRHINFWSLDVEGSEYLN